MTTALSRVLIPIDVSEPISLGGTLIETLPLANAVLLGYWPIPDQTGADQARDYFETEAQQRLQTVVDRFTEQGTDVQTELVFTNDRSQLIDQVTNKYNCQSVLIPGTESPPSGTTHGIVLVTPDADLGLIVTTLGSLFAETEVELFLFHAVTNQDEHLYDATEYMLRGMKTQLAELGIDDDRITWEQSTDRERLEAILSQVPDYDFVVLSESKPRLRERVFGSVQAKLAEKTRKPLLTIRTLHE
ncbi:universal stress protein [Halalkalirubrum salinum]|uniref:universal stress protein n=1 Tax=Halalkalirubrum salinum TaxID=2563889 RepID=UPI0010FBBAC4|nr:universal stress protein [Halalkalirubrum salinum]